MKQLINIKFCFMLKNVVFVLCFLLLWSCGHKSNIKYHESGLYVLVEDGDYINLEPRTQPVIEGYGIDEAYRRGMVPDKETAIKIAESIWYPIYGSHIYTELPFEADLEGDSVWTVHGTFPHGEGWVGGCAKIRIQKKDASIIYVIHEL
ncbi:MAG: hypothetical protein IKW97_03750 [Muribaculaceae bacterium]|nr:hypothetical protein [Muribaculaceae bacterium]